MHNLEGGTIKSKQNYTIIPVPVTLVENAQPVGEVPPNLPTELHYNSCTVTLVENAQPVGEVPPYLQQNYTIIPVLLPL